MNSYKIFIEKVYKYKIISVLNYLKSYKKEESVPDYALQKFWIIVFFNKMYPHCNSFYKGLANLKATFRISWVAG